MKKGFRILKFKKDKPIFEVRDLSKSFDGRPILKKLSLKIENLIEDNKMRKNYQRKAWKNFKFSSKRSSKRLDNFRKIIFSDSV